MKILIVDDSKAMRMIVKRTLRQAELGDHETEEAGDGTEASLRLGLSGLGRTLDPRSYLLGLGG